MEARRVKTMFGIHSPSDFFLLVAILGGLYIFSYTIYLALSVFWNGLILRKVNIPNFKLHMQVANEILSYPKIITVETWVTRHERKLVQDEVNRRNSASN